jgi:hypothetical protein
VSGGPLGEIGEGFEIPFYILNGSGHDSPLCRNRRGLARLVFD